MSLSLLFSWQRRDGEEKEASPRAACAPGKEKEKEREEIMPAGQFQSIQTLIASPFSGA